MEALRMKIVRCLFVAALALIAAHTPAAALDTLDADTMKEYGRTWLSDCKDNASPRVTVFNNALVFIRGDKRVASAGNVMGTATYYGQNPPDNYVYTLIGELDNGQQQLIFMIDRDKTGNYLTLMGDDKVMAQVGPDWKTLKFRPCDAPAGVAEAEAAPKPAAKPAPAAVASGVTAATAADIPAGPAMLEDPAFKKAWMKALGKLAQEDWLATLGGPSPAARTVTVAGDEYVLVHACKDHDCAENNTTLLWSAAKQKVYGKVRMAGKSTLLGNPPPAVAKDLGQFWFEQWGRQP
jgi:hypothetical protein